MLRVCSVLVMMALYRMGCMLQDALIGMCVLWRTPGAVGSASLRDGAYECSATDVVASPASLFHHED